MTVLRKQIEFVSAFATYRASEIIGEGGVGRVYAATDVESGKDVAIKLLAAERATAERRKRFENEYRFCSRTTHPNVIRVLDAGVLGSGKGRAPFVVMPRYQGSLRELAAALKTTDDRMRVVSAVLDGVEAAHLQNVVHRDLKPENILYGENGRAVVVADFGIARFVQEELYTAVETREASRLANFVYAAPEQRIRGREVDARADIYALGLMINELFTGDVPHGTGYRQIAAVDRSLSYLDEIIADMMRQDPKSRLATVEEVKKKIIAAHRHAVTLQRMSAAEKQVVPATTVDHPLVNDPPRIVDAAWEDEVLTITFDKAITQDWVMALHNIGSYAAVYNAGPEAFRFKGKQGYVSVPSRSAQDAINHFKNWIPRASEVLGEKMRRERQQEDEALRERLRKEREAADERARVNRSLRF